MQAHADSSIEETDDDSILDRVLQVIATSRRIPLESITANSSFEQLGIDSLDRINILFDLENEFDISIDDEQAKGIATIPQMVAGIRTLIESKRLGSEHTS